MTHLSKLALDRLASGMAPAPRDSAHVEDCPQCSEKLQRVHADADEVRGTPEWQRGLARVRSATPKSRRRWPGWWLALPGVTAGCLAAVFLLTAPDQALDGGQRAKEERGSGERVKGDAAIYLVPVGQEQPITELAEGERVRLVVRPAGHSHTLLVVVDEDGAVARLEGDAEFEVTPGGFVILAFFSAQPLDPGTAIAAVEQAVQHCPQRPMQLSCPSVGLLAREQARARAEYPVRQPR